jgi:triosephosphate isomerase
MCPLEKQLVDKLEQKISELVRQAVSELIAEKGSDLLSAWSTPGKLGGRKPLVVANWKMNLMSKEAREFVARLDIHPSGVEVVLCPPHILMFVVKQALESGSPLKLGGQNFYPEGQGAFTGEHCSCMLQDAGASYVIVGHSERRQLFFEDHALIRRKTERALKVGLIPILCIGEKIDEHKSGATFRIIRDQLSSALSGFGSPLPSPEQVVVAYEPVWAIGTGLTASAEHAQETCAFIRERLSEMFSWNWASQVRILYGGSATPDNVCELARQNDIDGFLVGGASLKPDSFIKIIEGTDQEMQA